MNDLYNTRIEHQGRTYRYDPDQDCFYPADRWASMSPLEAWSPLIIMCILSAIAIWAEYFR
jgi:hypothetical protein